MTSYVGGFLENSSRSYISTSDFSNSIFSYTPATRLNPGSLAVISGASGKCPARRILRETGKKLFPGVHSGVYTYMVSVIDNVNLWNGFIDPNSPLFAVYSTDMPSFFQDGLDAATGSPPDSGVPVITNGLVSAAQSVSAGTTVTAGTSITAGTTVRAGTSLSAGTSITAGTTVRAQKFLTSPVGSGTGSLGSPLTASVGTAGFNGSGTQVVYTTQVTPSSMIFVTVNNVGPRAATVVPNNGYFTVYSSENSDSSTFYWMIVN